MAYNLESLVQILNQFLQPHPHQLWILDPNKKQQIELLLEKACFLKEFFENSSPVASERIRSLESRIRDAAYHAEDIVESHLTDRLILRAEGERLLISPPDLLAVIEELDLVKEEMMKIIEDTQMMGSTSSLPVQDLNPKNIIVGISDDLLQLKDRLTGQPTKLEIIPIVGMGGIGKTTLASTLYDDQFLASHFDTHAWVTISQSYDKQQILKGLLKCVSRTLINRMIVKNEVIMFDEDGLALHLHKTLWGRRYLIVLDDMWNSEIWNDIKMSFPDESNGSRIMVTTRELSVANYLGSSQSSHHKMNFLNEVESWNLLRRRVFAEGTYSSELEEIGRNIAKDCGGLPLAIHVVGGFLSQLERIEESWIQVANNVRSTIINKNKHVSNILYLSYNYLPNHLKPCFLYMAAFPEDHKIRASALIRLWVAEGFLKPILGKTLEEVAKVYLKELVDRNLLLVSQQEIKGKVKSYIMHDLLREMCIRIAREEKFLSFMFDSIWESYLEDMQHMRRFYASAFNHFEFISRSLNLAKVTRSILLTGLSRIPYHVDDRTQEIDTRCTTSSRIPHQSDKSEPMGISGLQLLRILDISKLEDLQFPDYVGKLVNLRYLVFSWPYFKLVNSMATLCNLQTLIIYWKIRNSIVSYKLFAMPRLKHIKFKGSYPYYDLPDDERPDVQEDLETLSSVSIDNSFPKLLETIPNLKKLGISTHMHSLISSTIDMTCLSMLETLKCRGSSNRNFLSFLIFPPSLKKLTLSRCAIPLRYMESIGDLPNLQILKLQVCTFENRTWEPIEGGFCQLRLLVFEWLSLKKWMANETHYPRLERLVVQECIELEEIPNDIGEILTLEIIEVHGESNHSLLKSAKKIQNEQLELGNNALHVRINAYVDSFPRSDGLRPVHMGLRPVVIRDQLRSILMSGKRLETTETPRQLSDPSALAAGTGQQQTRIQPRNFGRLRWQQLLACFSGRQ